MNNLKEVDFLSRFPPVLAQDEKMLALGRLIAEELHITANEIEKNIIYANIDNLSETWLDVLAYDLHVDWYDYDYPYRILNNRSFCVKSVFINDIATPVILNNNVPKISSIADTPADAT